MSHVIRNTRRPSSSISRLNKKNPDSQWVPLTEEEKRIVSRVVACRADSAESVVYQEKSNNKRAEGYLIPVGEFNRATRAANYSVTYANF